MYGYMTYNVTPAQLLKAMKGEAEARKYYKKLMDMSLDDREKDIIEHFIEDENKHLSKFRMVYEMTTGKEPVLGNLKTADFSSYIEGIEQAIEDELETYVFYRDIYLSNNNPIIRDIFLEAFTDENEHIARLNYLYTKNRNG